MANNSNCSRCSRCSSCSSNGCGCLNTLRYLSSPWTSYSDCYQNFPFYNGPCPCAGSNGSCGCNNCGCSGCNGCNECNNCGCNSCSGCNGCNNCGCNGCNGCCSRCTYTRSSAGMFVANAPLTVGEGESIPLIAKTCNLNCFEPCGNCIRICKAGLYQVTWTANIPSYQNFCSRIFLSLNGSEVCGSGQTICTQADNTSSSATGQAMVNALPNSLLCLNSCSAFCLDSSCDVENVFTLTITRVQN